MITIIWDEIVQSMTWFIEGLRDFLFGSLSEKPRHTIDPRARYADNLLWPDWGEPEPMGCEYCGQELARCGCGKYGISPIARALPGIIAIDEWGEFLQSINSVATR